MPTADWIATRAWALQYSLEQAREKHAFERHLWRQAGACLGLALLRLVGVRYA